VWTLMADHDLIPPDGEIKHLLWTLHFLKAYPTQATVCSTVGGSTGAIDPKTTRLKVNVDCGTRLGWIFLPEILCGLTDRSPLVSIRISKFIALAWHISWRSSRGWKRTMVTLVRHPRR
jgi:hypothetical protein